MSCREVLWYLVFSGSAINYMLKISLNLVIVAMVVPRTNKVSSSTAAQCTVDKPSLFSINNTTSNVTFPSYQSTPSSISVRPIVHQLKIFHVELFNIFHLINF